MSGFATISAKNRELAGGYATIGGKWRKLTDGWATKNGVWQQILSSLVPMAISSLPVGSLIQLNESGVGVNFRIVHQGLPSSLYDSSCNGTWVVREAIHSKRTWDSTNNDYANSDIHTYLNGTYLDLFDANTQSIIKQVKIPYQKGTGSGGSIASGSNGLSTKIFLLSGYEVGWTTSNSSRLPVDGACLSYFSGTSEIDSKRISYYEGTSTNWWLRSVYTNNTSYAWFVYYDGDCSGSSCSVSFGVRSAMILDSTAMVNGSTNADGSYTLLV